MGQKTLSLRRPDTCAVCARNLAAGDTAWWDSAAKTATCPSCHGAGRAATDADAPALDRGHAGASAEREYERRKTNRETRIREAHPRTGGLLLWLLDAPQNETAWKIGEAGEVAVGASLEQRTAEGPAVILHDRRMPRSRANIDHIAIAPTGVYVIDAKAHTGNVKIDTPLFGAAKLRIAGRDRTKLIDGLDRQVAAVREALKHDAHDDVPVQGVLCFTNADLPVMRTLKMRGHLLLYRKALARRLNSGGPLEAAAIEAIARGVAAHLPAA